MGAATSDIQPHELAEEMYASRVVIRHDMASAYHQPSSLPERLSKASQYVEYLSDDLRAISLDIHDHPELRFKERHAHHVLTEYLRKQDGWEVTSSAYEIETAFVASCEGCAKGPVVTFNAEYDALPGIGHACGHNLIAIVSLAAALATAAVMREEQLAGRVVLFGTPAEEGGGGKIKLLKAGAYHDQAADVSFNSHPGSSADAAIVRTAAFAQYHVEYFGREAHAADRPWDGINALDALISAIISLSLLRQQTQPGDLIQYKIVNGGTKPNIIHAYASGTFVVRAPTSTRLNKLKARLHTCLEGAATSTGATLKATEGTGYLDHVPNRTLGRQYRGHFTLLGGCVRDPDIEELKSSTYASTDQGDISHAMPSLAPTFWIRNESSDGKQLGGPHTPDFANAARTDEAHQLSLRVAKALAATALDLLTIPGLLDEVKREYQHMKEHELTL